MSLQAMLWALNEAPWESATEALVLISLADYAGSVDSPWTNACPSHRTIAEAAQVTTRTVRRCLNDLEARGVITRGDQSVTAGFRKDRRPVVWNLNGEMKRATGGHSYVRPENMSARTNVESRGDTAVSYDPSLIDPSLNGASDDAPSGRLTYPDDFEVFWSHYPKRQGPNPKKPAFAKWKVALKSIDADSLVVAVKAYAASDLPADRSKIPQAMNWLSQARWEEQDTTSPDEWLKDCWRRGDTASVSERTGLIYGGVVWPDEIPSDPEEKSRIRLQQARKWIEENHDRIVGRMTNAV